MKRFRFSHICSSPQRVYILRGVQRRCVWAVGRLGVTACLACAAAAAVDRQARQSCRVWRPPDTLRRRTHLSGGRADSIHTARPDTTRRSCLCRVWCADVNWTIALNVFRLQIVCRRRTCIVGNPVHAAEGGRDTYKTALSCLAWRCELALIL